MSHLGELHGLKNIKLQKQVEIQPYTVGQFKTFEKQAGNPFATGKEGKFTAGVDGKIGITNNLTLDFTVNPDFGQVEADPSAIALDGFQIFFREQRPFFVENKNIFDYRFANNSDNVFYSRRIGRSPQGYPNTTTGEYVDMPTNTTILGAAKISGKTENGWSVGLLESVTGNMYAEVDNNGERRDEIVEPLTNYLAARAQKDFNKSNSYLGGIFTATNRNLNGNFSTLRKSAYTGGIDFNHQWKNKKYFVKGNVIASHVTGSKEAIQATQESITHLFQRVDAGHVKVDANRTSLTGSGGKITGGKAGGGNWRYNAGFIWRSPELELNDVGFLRQADEIRQFSQVRYVLLKPNKIFREARVNLNQFTTFDFDGNYNRIQYEGNAQANWKNNWWTEGGFGHKPRIFINTYLRGGPRWRFSDENFGFLFFGTDRRKKFNATLGYVNSGAKQDNFSFKRYVLRLNYQPIDALSLSLNTEFEKHPNKTQYVSQQDFGDTTRYILGEIDQQTWSTSLRINYNINPNLTIQYYGQPFVARGRYQSFNYVKNAAAENLHDRVSWYRVNQITRTDSAYLIDEDNDGTTDYSFGNPDFSFVQFRSNLVARWEYIPGSEIYLVWSQGVTGFGDPKETLTRNINNQILKKRPENTFLIKATYRFMM